MEEIWKDIEGYEGYYQVSSFGRVRSVDRHDSRGYFRKGRLMATKDANTGYKVISLSKNAISKHYQIHRLVAIAFIPNPNNFPIINHKDENPKNNYANNLEWCDYKYNANYGKMTHKFRSSLVLGEKHPRHKLTKHDVKEIRERYVRGSRTLGCAALAKEYGVYPTTINHIVNNKIWIEEKEA